MSANPFADLDQPDPDPTPTLTRRERPRGGRRSGRDDDGPKRRFPVWGWLVLLLVGVAASLFIWDQAKTRYHKNRLAAIKKEWYDLYDKIKARERAIEAANPMLSDDAIFKRELEEITARYDPDPEKKKPKPGMSPERARELRRQLIENDPEMKQLRQQIWDIEQERDAIWKDHPDWNRPQEWRY